MKEESGKSLQYAATRNLKHAKKAECYLHSEAARPAIPPSRHQPCPYPV